MLALRPYRGDLTLIGGWAHRLSRLHELAQPVDFESLDTQDVDLAIPGSLPPREEDLSKVLTHAGFKERFLGEENPPVTHYQFGDELTFYAEFLTPLVGPPRAATKTIAGVSAQALRHLDILMIEPWSVGVRQPEYPVGPKALEVRITNATSYLAQKVLVLNKRNAADRAKDILYVHDTLVTFGRSLAELQRLWIEAVLPKVHPTSARMLRASPSELFADVTEAVRGASRIATGAGRSLVPEDIAQACRTGLAKVFT
jgi:hypothetical protein